MPRLSATVSVRAGILNWLLEGAREWQQPKGLNPPETVVRASREYQSEQDKVGVFIAERCNLGPTMRARVTGDGDGALYPSYQSWCEENGQNYPLGSPNFKKELLRRPGIWEPKNGWNEKGTHEHVRGLYGIQLRLKSEDKALFDEPDEPTPKVKTRKPRTVKSAVAESEQIAAESAVVEIAEPMTADAPASLEANESASAPPPQSKNENDWDDGAKVDPERSLGADTDARDDTKSNGHSDPSPASMAEDSEPLPNGPEAILAPHSDTEPTSDDEAPAESGDQDNAEPVTISAAPAPVAPADDTDALSLIGPFKSYPVRVPLAQERDARQVFIRNKIRHAHTGNRNGEARFEIHLSEDTVKARAQFQKFKSEIEAEHRARIA